MRRKLIYNHGRRFPVASNPKWERWSRRLKEYIWESPRKWEDLYIWAEERSMSTEELRQLVAYLELTYRAETFAEGYVIRRVDDGLKKDYEPDCRWTFKL